MFLSFPIPNRGQRLFTGALPGSSDALALAELATREQPLAIVTATATDAQRLLAEMRWFAAGARVHLLPDWETLPYDSFSPHQDLVSERLETLYLLATHGVDAVIVPVTTALMRLPPRAYLSAYTFFLKQGARLAPDSFREQLTMAGYSHVSQVVAPGEYSYRGGLIDLFPMGSTLPYRIDLLDDEIESIRTFDVDTQRSIYKVNEVRLLPAREFPLDEPGRTQFRRRFREVFEGDPSKRRLYKDIGSGSTPAGIEYYLPLFFDETATLTDYLPGNTVIAMQGDIPEAIGTFCKDTQSRFEMLRGDSNQPILPPAALYQRDEEFFASLKPYARIDLGRGSAESAEADLVAPPPPVAVDRRATDPLSALKHFVAEFPGRVLLTAEGPGRRETMLEFLHEYDLHPELADTLEAFTASRAPLMLGVSPLYDGFVLPGAGVAFLTETELYATTSRARAREREKRTSAENVLRDLSEVKVGAPVVHESHGVGRYHGLVTMDVGGDPGEFLLLEYDGGDKLYVPVSQLQVISRYAGAASDAVSLHRLGSGDWQKARRKAAKQVRDTAAELLHLYAKRAAREGHSFTLRHHDYEAFCAGFPFEETADQAAAITSVIQDLESGKPMDRLICGDVGFGKTEVALRAAFVAIADGKQVAVLVPTTLLAEQHFQNFSNRFADWPVKLAELSRFRSAKESSAAIEGLATGAIDIVIGTHKLLSADVKFGNLGLVIIDEEHRFGVRQKERLKQLRAEVDVLTLTATPIPRTLAMSLEGLRDFSVIATAPQRRLAIKTFVSRYSDGLVREAVLRELKRGGQVYFLHNEVETIKNWEAKLAALVPEARIRVAHGQMAERELEHAMRDFYQARFNVLLCTTIIETGIDVPNANTIIMNRADRFGLAQLHQLRGRVGRSHHQAYAYLLTPDEEAVTAQAKKRLEAIQMMEELGSGFYLAMHDLEIRGAGEVLGESQSGEMQQVGFSLYIDMLNHAVRSLRNGKEPDLEGPLHATVEINLHSPALLPTDYCADVHERLVLYKRLANCESVEQLEKMAEELVDRFGRLPDPAKALVETHRLRLMAEPLGVVRIDAAPEQIVLTFKPNPPVEPSRIIALIQSRKGWRLAGPEKLRIDTKLSEVAMRIVRVREILRDLREPVAA
ncbi:MAG: transcription-repair coupling factor [Betaproteobacteria bacterium]|nr:transcription-repair coupling factor [Betaproteobacteria bacterium]